MSNGVSIGSIVTGCLLLVLTLISVTCGGVVMSKLTRPVAGVSIGFWGLYFIVPAVFSILAGVKKQSSLLPVALGTNILGIILAIVGLSSGAAFWVSLTHCIQFDTTSPDAKFSADHCCPKFYQNTCSNLVTARNGTAVVTIIFVFFAVITLVESIYGCIGTCYAPQTPTVIVSTVQPGSMVMTTQSYPAYNQQLPSCGEDQVFVDIKARSYD